MFELLDESETQYLSECYNAMYPGAGTSVSGISSGIYKYSQFRLSNELFGSQSTRSKRSSYILASGVVGVLRLRVPIYGRLMYVITSNTPQLLTVLLSLTSLLLLNGINHIPLEIFLGSQQKCGVMISLSHLVQHHIYPYRELSQNLWQLWTGLKMKLFL